VSAGAPEPTLEQAMERLEEIARQLEGGELELTDSLGLYEEGVRLLRRCEELLTAAETRIERLRASAEGFRLEPFEEQP
jgi:exodeoxyribonuclease VII small subunit